MKILEGTFLLLIRQLSSTMDFQNCPCAHHLERRSPPWCLGHGWPQFTPDCFPGLILGCPVPLNFQQRFWGCSNVIWAVSYLLEACASTKATRLHSLTLTGSRRPQDFPTFDPISCVDGAQSLKPSFNLPSSLQNVYSDKWSSGEGCWIGWKCSVPGCILYFDYHIDAST